MVVCDLFSVCCSKVFVSSVNDAIRFVLSENVTLGFVSGVNDVRFVSSVNDTLNFVFSVNFTLRCVSDAVRLVSNVNDAAPVWMML